MRLLSKELLIPYREKRPVVTGFVSYVSASRPLLMHCWGWEDYSDGYDDYVTSLSADNGKSWSEPVPFLSSREVPEGRIRFAEPCALHDAESGRLLVVAYRALYPRDKLDVDTVYSPVATSYDPVSGTWSEKETLDLTPGRSLGVSFSFPLRTSTGRILVPAMRQLLGADGKPIHYKGCWAPVDEPLTIIGERDGPGLRAAGFSWRVGKPVPVEAERSSRGLDENTLFELQGGRIVAVIRGDNSMFPERPGYKWVSYSDTAGEDWSDPVPLCDTAGEPIQSGSSGSALFRSERSGRPYWIGNLCLRGERPKGNHPRSTLYVVEVREEPFALKRETAFAVDERGYNDDELIQLSNFRYYQDRATGELVLFMDRYCARGHEEWWRSDYYRYRVDLG